MDKVINFLKDVKMELTRVTWPTRAETVKFTLVVLGMSLFLAAFLGGLDFLFTLVLNRLLF